MRSLNHLLRPRARHGVWTLALLSISLAGSGWLLWQAYGVHLHNQKAAARNAALSQKLGHEARLAAKPAVGVDAQHEDAIQAERQFPWAGLLRAIEQTASKDIELLEFLPDKSGRQLVLKGEAKDQKALLAYLEALNEQAVLRVVHLAHQQTLVRDRLETVEFEIRAKL